MVNGGITFLCESQKFDPHRIETPNLIETIFGTVDYVGEMTPRRKISCKSVHGGFSANG